jgi:succinate dehydrogenase hydrophobic anchor subunit
MKESWSMILTYITAMVLIFVLTFHFLLQGPLAGKSFEDTLAFSYSRGNLVSFEVIFGLLLYTAILHGLNGLRVIALEWFHPEKKAWLLNLIVVALMAFFLALGSYTLVAVG